MEDKEPTIGEVLQAIKAGFSALEVKMATKDDTADIEARLGALESKVDTGFSELRTEVSGIRADLVSVKHDVSDLKVGSFTKLEKEDLLARIKYIEDDLGIDSGM